MLSKYKLHIIAMILAVGLMCPCIVGATVNTVFDVPTISDDINPDAEIYKSPNKNVKADKWSYGLFGYILNTTNLDSAVAELVANVPATGHSRRGVSVYPNGAHLSDANIAALAGAGWNELELYYDDFYVIGSMPSAGLQPDVEKTDKPEITTVLEGAGYTGKVGYVTVTGVNMDTVNIGYYNQDLNFLSRNACNAYKYMADVAVFIPVAEAYYASYGPYVLEMYDLQNIESDTNGIYVVSESALPDAVVVSVEELPAYREKVQQERLEQEKLEQERLEKERLEQEKREQGVAWDFGAGQAPADFVADVKVSVVDEEEVFVSFAYSGELPENTTVTIYFEKVECSYEDGQDLHLYYCNQEKNLREYVSAGRYTDEQVTFDIRHCSDYIITSVDHGETYGDTVVQEDFVQSEGQNVGKEPEVNQSSGQVAEDSGSSAGIIAAVIGCVAVCAVAGVIIFKKRK